MVKIVWDEVKRARNLEKHDLDFADLDLEFFAGALVLAVKQRRLKAIGAWSDTMIAVIFMRLGAEGISLISLRPASRRERKLYEQGQPQATRPH